MSPPAASLVSPPRPDHEAWAVAATIAGVIQLTLLGTALRAPDLPKPASAQLGPGELALGSLPARPRRVATELLVSVRDLGELRAPATKRWPSPAALLDEGIPPFADDPPEAWLLDEFAGSARYHRRTDQAQGWLLELTEGLAPGLDSSHQDQRLLARDHRRLTDGTVLHFKLWWHPDPPATPGLPVNPAMVGWRRVVVPEATEGGSS